jgi:hypothetical protein
MRIRAEERIDVLMSSAAPPTAPRSPRRRQGAARRPPRLARAYRRRDRRAGPTAPSRAAFAAARGLLAARRDGGGSLPPDGAGACVARRRQLAEQVRELVVVRRVSGIRGSCGSGRAPAGAPVLFSTSIACCSRTTAATWSTILRDERWERPASRSAACASPC